MPDLPFLLALTAGMLAAVNPCGFALLPAYLSLLIAGDGSRGMAVGRALLLTSAMTVGFVAVFGSFGLILAPAMSSVAEFLPWLTIGIGLLLIPLGGWLLAGRRLPGPGWQRAVVPTSSLPSMIGFGAAYAIASLTCTIGPFLAIVGAGFQTDSVLAGLTLFVTYAAGMGLVVGVAATSVALAHRSLITHLRRAGGWASHIGGGLMVIAGLYVAYYGWYEVRLASGGTTDDPIIAAAGKIQIWLAGTVEGLGPGLFLVALVLLIGATTVVARRRQDSKGPGR